MSASAPFSGSALSDAENPFRQLLTNKEDRVRWVHSGIFWAWGTLFGLLMLTSVAYYHVKSDTENDARKQFSNRKAEVVQAIHTRMISYTETLQGGLGLFRASSHVDRSEFHAYVSTLNIGRKLPGIQGLGYAEWVKPSERAAYERRIRKDGFPTFKIRPAGEREVYSSITYLEPFDERNKKAFGYDMYAQETRRLAMERARDTGDVAISGKVTLVQENSNGAQAGFLMYTPFYGPGDPGTIAERRRESRGFIYSAFRMEDLMKGILGPGSADVRLQIFDEGQPTSDSLMFDSAPETDHDTPAFVAVKIVTIGQRDWMIQTSSLPPFERFLDPQKSYIVLIAGMLTSALVFSVLWSFANTRRRAQDIAGRITVSLNEATQQAKDRQARISAVVETVVDGIITIDNRGTIETFNRAAEEIFGYTSDEISGQNVKTLMPQPFRREHDSYLHNYRETGDAQVIGNDREVAGLRKDGTTFPMDLAIGEMMIDGRQMFTGIVRDISERKQIEQMRNEATQQAKDRQARISAVVETVVDGIITIDNRGKIETFNRAAEKIFGYTSDEVTGQNVKTLMPQSFRNEHDSYLHNYRETGDAQVIGNDREVIGLRKDGTTFAMDLAIGEMVIDGRQMFTGIVRDISERKQIEQMRNEATQQASDRQARISAVLETVVDGIITIDNRGKIETFNRAAEKIFGYTSAEITGVNVKSLMPAPFREEHDGYLKNFRETGDAQVIGNDREVVGRRKDGTTFPMDLAIGEMVIDGQQMFTGIVRDISERKEIERMKNEFVSTVSHELRTPLTSMMGSLGLLKADVLGEMPEQTKAMLDIAHKNGQRLINLLNDILDVEKMEAGKLEYVMKPLEVMPLMENAIEANLGYGDAHGVRFIIGQESPAVIVQADEARLMQVMSNLMSNAAKFSAKGDEVEISVTTTDDSVRIAVADKGPGIRPEHYEKIFKKFSQADSSDNRAKDGTGLGLSITKSIVESHGGKIDFTSEVDKGTTFFFELPLCPIQSLNEISDKEPGTVSTV